MPDGSTVAGEPAALTVHVREYLASFRWTLLAVALTVFGILLPVAIVPYAFSDDYRYLFSSDGWGGTTYFTPNTFDANAINGRPLAGLFTQWVFAAAGTIENLRFVRLIAVVTVVALALLVHWALVRAGVSSLLAALIAVLLCTLPPLQVYASWAVLFGAPSAALLAGGGSLMVVAAIDGPRNLSVSRLVRAVLLVFIALQIYQPAAMYFWVFFAIALVGAARDPARSRSSKLVKAHFAVGFAALALGYLAIKVTVGVMGTAAPEASHNELTHDVIGKARWFIHQPLYRALNLFDLTPTHVGAAAVACIALTGITLWLLRWGARPLLYGVVGLVLIPLSYLPNLVVTDMWPSYRTQVALGALVALYACLGAIGLWLVLVDWLRTRLTTSVLNNAAEVALVLGMAFVAASVVIAAKNVTNLFVRAHMTEQRVLREQIAALPDDAERIAFVQTDCYSFANVVASDEFGRPSSTLPWTFEPSVDLILHEQGRLQKTGPRPTIDVVSFNTTVPQGEPVIDLRGSMPYHTTIGGCAA